VLRLLAVALLVLANALFVAAEFSLVAVDRGRVAARADAGSTRARVVAHLLERLPFTLSGTQLGVTVCSLALGFVAEPTIAQVLQDALGFLPSGLRHGVAVALTLVLVTAVTLVVGELLPKGLAVARPMETALALATPVRIYRWVFGPLITVLYASAERVVRRLGIDAEQDIGAIRTIDELRLLISSSRDEGTLDADSAVLLTRTIRFAGKTATEALVPRLDMVTVPADGTVADLAMLSLRTGHSRFPVIGASADDVVGVAHVLDALAVPARDRAAMPVTAIAQPAKVVPEGRDLESLLTDMRSAGSQLVIVADEYGGVAGLVTLEDLVEEIVGEIADEHDPAAPLTAPPPDGTVVVEGTLHLDDVAEQIGLELPEGPYETIAGFVLDRLGHLPVPGERVRYERWTLEVLAMDRRRIAAVRLREGREP
jgi:CBS domain containing-hemolysin-like protein